MVSTDPVAWITALLEAAGSAHGGGQMYQCPAHNDSTPSLSVAKGREGAALLKCFGGCTYSDVLTALRLPPRALYAPPPVAPSVYARAYVRVVFPVAVSRTRARETSKYRLVAAHNYTFAHRLMRYRADDGTKRLAWQHCRDELWRPGMAEGVTTADMPLYRLTPTPLTTPIALVESESSVDALLDAGIAATTWAGGAANPPINQLRRELAHTDVVVVADNDDAGIACLERLARAAHFTHYVLPPPDHDARDLLNNVGAEHLRIMLSGHLTYPT